MDLNIKYADSFFKRFRGLMFRKSMPENEALLIVPCNQIHTFNMKFAIDVVYLSKENKVVFIDENIKPGKVCKPCKNANAVLELNSGMAKKFNIKLDDIIERK